MLKDEDEDDDDNDGDVLSVCVTLYDTFLSQ